MGRQTERVRTIREKGIERESEEKDRKRERGSKVKGVRRTVIYREGSVRPVSLLSWASCRASVWLSSFYF